MIDNTTRAVNLYGNTEAYKYKQNQIEGIELKLQFNIEEIKFLGFADLVLNDSVKDFKTTSKTPKKDNSYNFQVNLYSIPTKKNRVSLETLVLGSNKIVKYDFEATAKDETRATALKLARGVYNAKKTGDFAPTGIFHPWACNFCGYADNNICKYKQK
jgi:hypothetical protein